MRHFERYTKRIKSTARGQRELATKTANFSKIPDPIVGTDDTTMEENDGERGERREMVLTSEEHLAKLIQRDEQRKAMN